MEKQDAITLMNSIQPGFFKQERIQKLNKEWVYEEMLLPLETFDEGIYQKELDESVTFGYYEGDLEVLKETVGKVSKGWVENYNGKNRVYCGYINGKVVSFCIIENNGTHEVNGKMAKLGGPGCVGTLPEYRRSGIGLTMIKRVTQILKEEGYDYGYVHYTGVAPWYGKLGYQTFAKWNSEGVI